MMIRPNFSQTIDAHLKPLIALNELQTGHPIPSRCIDRLHTIVEETTYWKSVKNEKKPLFFRFEQNYAASSHEWGEFQAHRRALGLVGLVVCSRKEQMDKIEKIFEKEKQQFDRNDKNATFDSRLVIFLPHSVSFQPRLQSSMSVCAPFPMSDRRQDVPDVTVSLAEDDLVSMASADSSTVDSTGDSHSQGVAADYELNLDFPNRRNFDLESSPIGRHSWTEEILNASQLSPDGVSLSTDSRDSPEPELETTFRIDLGKKKKHWILVRIDNVVDEEAMRKDIQSFAEGLFWILEAKRMESHKKPDRLLMTPFERKELVGVDKETKQYKKRRVGRLRKHIADLHLLAGLYDEAALLFRSAQESLRKGNDLLWLASAIEGLCVSAAMLKRTDKPAPKGVSATAKEIFLKYQEAVYYYRQASRAAALEIEASVKAARLADEFQCRLMASDFLQNAFYIELDLSPSERVEKYLAISQIYGHLGFHRKAAFYRRTCALVLAQSVGLDRQLSLNGYSLLLECLPAYGLELDILAPTRRSKRSWPLTHFQLLYELVVLAKNTGHVDLALRHTQQLFLQYYQTASESSMREMLKSIEHFVAQSRPRDAVNAKSLSKASIERQIDNKVFVIPPVPMIKFPIFKSFRVLSLATPLRPYRLKNSSSKNSDLPASVFIYYSSLDRGGTTSSSSTSASATKSELWCQNEVCDIQIQAYNPLPIELEITSLSLLCDGIEFECYPCMQKLPPQCGPVPIKLGGVPKSPGVLRIKGYSSTVFGIESDCPLSCVADTSSSLIEIEVTPALPRLNVATSLEPTEVFTSHKSRAIVVASGWLSLIEGEKRSFELTLTNQSAVSVDQLSLTCEVAGVADCSAAIGWKEADWAQMLPIPVGVSKSLRLDVETATRDPREWQRSISSIDPEQSKPSTYTLEALLQLEYSGGGGGHEPQYGRRCSVLVELSVVPLMRVISAVVSPVPTNARVFRFSLELINFSAEEEVKVTWSDDAGAAEVAVPAGKRQSVVALVRRTRVPAELAPYERRHFCEDYIRHQLQLTWKARGTSGHLMVKSGAWEEEDIRTMDLPPIFFDFFVDEQPLASQCQVRLNRLCSLTMLLTNNTGQILNDVTVQCNAVDADGVTAQAFAITGWKRTCASVETQTVLQLHCLFQREALLGLLVTCRAHSRDRCIEAKCRSSLSLTVTAGGEDAVGASEHAPTATESADHDVS